MPICVPTTPATPSEEFDYLPWLCSLDEALPLDFAFASKIDADSMSFDHISTVLSRCFTPPPESLPPSSAASSPSDSRSPSPMYLSLFMDGLFDSDQSGSSSLSSSPYSSSPASPACDASLFSSSPSSPSSPKLGRRKNSETKASKIKKIAKMEVAKPTKRSKAIALATKRDSHNISERNRRQELKSSFNLLQNLVPNLVSSNRSHTGTVLKETIAYVLALQQQEEQLLAAKNALLVEQSMLIMSA